ncbi:MAG: tetratricopeptide repeat protein, partial [Chloroflexota bacterium]
MATVSLQQAFEQARNWIESNDPERAIGLTRHILEYHPNNLDAYCILGEAYLANRQLDEAQEAFERVLSSDPESIPAHVGLGITFERQGMMERAVSEFEQAWEIKPDLPELRSQLLRLYTDAWGSEQAQLRLSRSGLARLYAKGHMLPQAIEEFRQVITDQPDRLDARVALVEALWRDGQEDDAIAESRDILSQYPNALKANLILGYLKMSYGEPEGQHFWDIASQLDPHHVVGRALFDALPVDDQREPSVEEWDESSWEAQRSLDAQEHAPATRPMAVTAVTDILASTPDPELLQSEQESVSSSNFPSSDDNSDDFLNELLNLDVVNSAPEDNTRSNDIISADDQLLGSTPSDNTVDITDVDVSVAPFSLEELGLSQAEIDSLDSLGGEARAEAPLPTGDSSTDVGEGSSGSEMEPDLAPFSLEELGLSQAEIDSLDSLGGEARAEAPLPTGDSSTDV